MLKLSFKIHSLFQDIFVLFYLFYDQYFTVVSTLQYHYTISQLILTFIKIIAMSLKFTPSYTF